MVKLVGAVLAALGALLILIAGAIGGVLSALTGPATLGLTCNPTTIPADTTRPADPQVPALGELLDQFGHPPCVDPL